MATKTADPTPRGRTQRAAAPVTAEDVAEGDTGYPKTFYKKQPVSAKYPNGYEAKQVADEAAAAKLGDKWKDSPEGMDPEYPHGHQG